MNANTNAENTVIDNAIVEVKPDNALVVIDPERYATDLFAPFQNQLTTLKRRAGRTDFDVTTKPGMVVAKELRAAFVKVRTAADKAKTEAKRPIDQAGKALLARYQAIATAAQAEEDKIASVIKAEETRIEQERQAAIAAERARTEAIEARLAHIRGIPQQMTQADSTTIKARISELLEKQLDPKLYDEFLDQAAQAMIDTIEALRQLETQAVAREDEARRVAAERAELQRMKAAEAERQAKEAEAQRQQAAAAAAMQKQQQQMADIMEIQGLAAALEAAGQHQDRASIGAAIARAEAFDPASFGAMAGMAKLARDAAYPLLVGLLESLPQAAPLTDMLMGSDSLEQIEDQPIDAVSPVISDTVPIEADDTGVVVGQAVIVDVPRKVIPAARHPGDLDILQVIVEHFHVSNDTALGWIATFDVSAVRASLAKA